VRGWAHVIKEDTVSPNLLFLGTEFGLFISNDGGERWAQYKGSNFPAVAVDDLVIHPRTSDLVLATHGRGIWIIDDISPLRALTPEIMQEDAGFLPIPPGIQWMETQGGWPEGANSFNGQNRPEEATIPYYQRTRHIFGDLKIEIFDSQGKLVDTIATSKHRGVNRATWSMHLKPPKVPPAASASFGAAFGPRVVPGTYTIKMTKGDKTYTSKLDVVLDPRAKFTVEDRKAQFDLATKLAGMLNHMSWAVDSIVNVRDTALRNANQLKTGDPLKPKLIKLAADSDAVRSKIVATKEGGAITGEERLREFLAGLYSDVNGYEGKPTDSQVARTDVLARELEDVIKEFQNLVTPQLTVNKQLSSKKLQPIQLISEQDWQKAQNAAEGVGPATGPGTMRVREMD
ncbi:MAG TPA: T9SS type A sorting domain-containing protein, partial [Terriglobales bacterium]|nr:T9SS type A sorting domain-containing protein [Terriglobales bacterium]